MKIITLFSGVGMQECAIKRVLPNVELINFCEFDKKISKCFELVHQEPSEKNIGDITLLNKDDYVEKLKQDGNDDIDLIVSSFPCKSFSIQGKKKGFEDKQNGGLFEQSMMLVRRILPRFVIFENVKNITCKTFDGKKIMMNAMNDIGYRCYSQILNSKDYGIPQNRERFFMVCVRDSDIPFQFPDTIPLTTNVSNYLESNNHVKRSCSERLRPYMSNEYQKKYRSNHGLRKVFDGTSQYPNVFRNGFTLHRVYSIYGNAPTFTTANDCHFWEIQGKLLPIERWRMMGLAEKDYELLKKNNVSDGLIHKLCGNGIVVDVFYHLFLQLIRTYNVSDVSL